MIGFRAIELREGNDLRDNWPWERAGRVELLLVVFGQLALRFGVVEDHRTILRTRVVALAVVRGRVVRLPEYLQQFLIGDHRRVVGDLDRLGVSSRAGANLAVCGVLYRATAVPG